MDNKRKRAKDSDILKELKRIRENMDKQDKEIRRLRKKRKFFFCHDGQDYLSK